MSPKIDQILWFDIAVFDDFEIFWKKSKLLLFSTLQLNAYKLIFHPLKDKEVFSNWSQNRKKL